MMPFWREWRMKREGGWGSHFGWTVTFKGCVEVWEGNWKEPVGGNRVRQYYHENQMKGRISVMGSQQCHLFGEANLDED